MLRPDRIICGDAATSLGTLPEASVDLTITSPPYFGHRDYGVPGQIGKEAVIDDYVAKLQTVLVELLRVTVATGSCFLVLGDTYRRQKLLLVPHRVALAANQVGWAVRNDLIWNKLDPPPESPRNRWRSGHEHILFLTKRTTGYKFHMEAIRVPYAETTVRRWGNGQTYDGQKSRARRNAKDSRMRHGQSFTLNPNGCVPTDVWRLPSGDSPAHHYATFPESLVGSFILACSDPGNVVLDPFAGSGTTCRVAKETGRHFIGIELNPNYAEMAAKAVGLDWSIQGGPAQGRLSPNE